MTLLNRLILTIATCFGLGYSPYFPGTCGALVGIACYVPLAFAVPGEPWQSVGIGGMLLFWTVFTIALGTWSERHFGVKDSQTFVTDEVVGFLFTVLLFHLPDKPILTTLWAFPITRVIDIAKIPPAKSLEKLPAGWGVVADDLLGSIYAAGVLHLLYWLSPGWFR
jgi:phosphatidylglycerophosphatase A